MARHSLPLFSLPWFHAGELVDDPILTFPVACLSLARPRRNPKRFPIVRNRTVDLPQAKMKRVRRLTVVVEHELKRVYSMPFSSRNYANVARMHFIEIAH